MNLLKSSPQVFILAGGLGTRLRPVVSHVPKSMAPIGPHPFLELLIQYLKEREFKEIVLCVSYQKDAIQSYFQGGEKHGVRIQYSIESDPLGTGGAIWHARDKVKGLFLILNGDTYPQFELMEFLDKAKFKDKTQGIVGLISSRNFTGKGRVEIDQEGKVTAFVEKDPDQLQKGESQTVLVNAGVYLFSPGIFEQYPQFSQGKCSLENDIFPLLVCDQVLDGIVLEGAFVDIGTPDDYRLFCERIRM